MNKGMKVFIAVVLVIVLAAVALLGVVTSGFRDWSFIGNDTECSEHLWNSGGYCDNCGVACSHSYVDGVCSICGVHASSNGDVSNEDGEALQSGVVYPLCNNLLFGSVSAESRTASEGIIVEATITPSYAYIGDVTWRLAFTDPKSEWALNKNVEDYVSLTRNSGNRLVATVQCIQSFGEQIQLICSGNSGESNVRAVCTLDFLGHYTVTAVHFLGQRVESGGVGFISFPSYEDALALESDTNENEYTRTFLNSNNGLRVELGILGDCSVKPTMPETFPGSWSFDTVAYTDEQISYFGQYNMASSAAKTSSDICSSICSNHSLIKEADGTYRLSLAPYHLLQDCLCTYTAFWYPGATATWKLGYKRLLESLANYPSDFPPPFQFTFGSLFSGYDGTAESMFSFAVDPTMMSTVFAIQNIALSQSAVTYE